jgi:hypothetical protein
LLEFNVYRKPEVAMIRMLVSLALGLALAGGAWPQDKDKPTAQQERMKSCNAQASKKELKGDERKAFMSDCLKGNQPTAQQERMKSCNAQASKKELKGDERKEFMSKCLKADSDKGDKELTAQQKKMRTCNAQASKKDLKGDERKAFMSKCLSG